VARGAVTVAGVSAAAAAAMAVAVAVAVETAEVRAMVAAPESQQDCRLVLHLV
jgi:hypothetical protein